MLQPMHITEYCIRELIKPGDTVIDATAGNGNDTLKLCQAVGKDGRVYAFDIQKAALENTQKRLTEANMDNYVLILDSHANIGRYVSAPVKAAVFNLGYLPGGDHSIHTNAQTTSQAISAALELISADGFVSVCIYYGKNSGTMEKDGILDFLKQLDPKKYTVTLHDFYNRPNNPPLTAIITVI